METFLVVYRIYAPLTRKYARWFLVTFLAYGVSTILSAAAGPLLMKRMMDTIATGISPESAQVLMSLFGILVVVRVITFVGWRIGDRTATLFEVHVMRDLANTTFRKLTLHSYEFFAHTFVGSLVSNTNKLVRSYETVGDFLVYNLFSEGSRLVISAAILFYFSTALGLIYLALIIAYASLYFFQIRERLPADNERNDAESATTGTLADALTNILTIKTFAQTHSERKHFGHYVDREYDARYGVWQLGNVQRGIQRGVLTTFELTALGMALYLWHAGAITAGTIVLLQLYLLSAMDSVFNLSRNLTKTVSAISDASVMAAILEQPLSVTDPKHPEASRMQTGAIVIRDMSFAYEGTNDVFTNFNLSIPAGQKVGLVGHSGSGKTTITKLLLRFIDAQSGGIEIDGQDIRSVTQDDLRRAIAYVPQEPLLFHRTIGENIAYGKPDAQQEELEAVAERAHAHEFISRLPHGYDTLVGERGVRLSGGERQRVAIARAMIKNAPILILDEATSALDSHSEMHIQAAFEEAMHGRTTIVIAHRLSTIQKMDRIIVFDRGNIVEDGSHAELLKTGGVYASLWHQQAGGFISE